MQILPDGEVNISSQMLEVLSIPAKGAEEKPHHRQKAQIATALKCFFFPRFCIGELLGEQD